VNALLIASLTVLAVALAMVMAGVHLTEKLIHHCVIHATASAVVSAKLKQVKKNLRMVTAMNLNSGHHG